MELSCDSFSPLLVTSLSPLSHTAVNKAQTSQNRIARMFGRICAMSLHIVTTVAVVSADLIAEAAKSTIAPPLPMVAGAAAICTASFVCNKIARQNSQKGRRGRRPSKTKVAQVSGCSSTSSLTERAMLVLSAAPLQEARSASVYLNTSAT